MHLPNISVLLNQASQASILLTDFFALMADFFTPVRLDRRRRPPTFLFAAKPTALRPLRAAGLLRRPATLRRIAGRPAFRFREPDAELETGADDLRLMLDLRATIESEDLGSVLELLRILRELARRTRLRRPALLLRPTRLRLLDMREPDMERERDLLRLLLERRLTEELARRAILLSVVVCRSF